MKTSKLLAGLVLSLTAALAQANLLTNGSFESFSGSFSASNLANNYKLVAAGNAFIDSWTVGNNSVDVVFDSAYGAITDHSIDIRGGGNGSVAQSFGTTAGQQYLLNFDLSSNLTGTNTANAKRLDVSFNDVLLQTLYAPIALAAPSFQSFYYTATTTGLTTLKFSSYTSAGGQYGAVIDNVSVTAVPEPETLAMLLAGLGLMGSIALRRNKSNV